MMNSRLVQKLFVFHASIISITVLPLLHLSYPSTLRNLYLTSNFLIFILYSHSECIHQWLNLVCTHIPEFYIVELTLSSFLFSSLSLLFSFSFSSSTTRVHFAGRSCQHLISSMRIASMRRGWQKRRRREEEKGLIPCIFS